MTNNFKATVYIFLAILFCWQTYAGDIVSKATQEAEAYEDNDDEEIEDVEKTEFSELPEEILWEIIQYAAKKRMYFRLVSTGFKNSIDKDIKISVEMEKLVKQIFHERAFCGKPLDYDKLEMDTAIMKTLNAVFVNVNNIELVANCWYNSYEINLAKMILDHYGKKKTLTISYNGPTGHILADLEKEQYRFISLHLRIENNKSNFEKFLKLSLQKSVVRFKLGRCLCRFVEKFGGLTDVLSASKVKTLDLDRCDIGRRYRYLAINFWTKLLSKTSITNIKLSDNELNDEDAKILAKALLNTQIKILDLFNNRISSDGARELIVASLATEIEDINLKNNCWYYTNNNVLSSLERIFQSDSPEYIKAKKECEREHGPVIEKQRRVRF